MNPPTPLKPSTPPAPTASTTPPSGKKVLFVLTSHGELGDSGEPTGFHLGETVEPWQILREAGHTVDFVSVRGGMPPMIGHDPADATHRDFLAAADGGALIAGAGRPEDVDAKAYDAVYFVGGHGTMWDFRDHPAIGSIARTVYENGGVVSAICHGPAALVDVRLADGSHLVAGHRLTAFSDESEASAGWTPWCRSPCRPRWRSGAPSTAVRPTGSRTSW